MVMARGLVRRRASSAASEIVRWFRMGMFDIRLNGKLIEEIAHTLRHLGADDRDIRLFVNWLCERECIVPLGHQRMGCIDPDDDHLFETALLSGARIIVSSDARVLRPPIALAAWLKQHDIRVLDEAGFCQFMRQRVFSPMVLVEGLGAGLL